MAFSNEKKAIFIKYPLHFPHTLACSAFDIPTDFFKVVYLM